MADNNQSVFYFSTFLFVVFPPVVALNLNLIQHLFLTFWGMWFLARKLLRDWRAALLAAVLWAFSTQITGSINNFSTLQALSWLPWVVWGGLVLVESRIGQETREMRVKNWLWRAFLLAFLISLQFLAGYPQHMIFSVMAAVVASFVHSRREIGWWPWLYRWSVAGLMSLILSAFAWLPFVEAFLNSTRMEQSADQAMVGSLHPAMLIKTIMPYFFDNPAGGIKWGPAWSGQPNVGIYVTWFGLLVLGWWFMAGKATHGGLAKKISSFIKQKSWRDWLVVLVVVGTLLFSLGERLPFFGLIQGLIPLFRVGRYPSMVMIVTNLLLVLLVAKAWRDLIASHVVFELKKTCWWLVGGLLVVAVSLWLIVAFWFPQIWTGADSMLAGWLSHSSFHTLERDWLIGRMITDNLLIASAFFVVALWLWNRKHYLVLILILGWELVYSTQGLLFFGPNSLYKLPKFPEAFSQYINPQYRWLTRNSNRPYTDYGTHWESMVVRAPFSDSYVDKAELTSGAGLARLRDGLTPDWNMAMKVGGSGGFGQMVGVPMVHGYTTLLPRDYAQIWSLAAQEVGTESNNGSPKNSADQAGARINFIDQVELSNPLLAEWSVRYYLVDSWYEVREDLSGLKLLAEEGDWKLYELAGAKPRFRLVNGSNSSNVANAADDVNAANDANAGHDIWVEPTIFKLTETPNKIEIVFDNPGGYSQLVVADRYDKHWRAWVNGREVEIKNCGGMRCIEGLGQGENKVAVEY